MNDVPETDWRTISIENEYNDIVKEITESMQFCPFYKKSSIVVLMAAASLAIKNGMRPIRDFKHQNDITHKDGIKEDLQCFMCAIYYSLDNDKNLYKLKDRGAVTKVFEQYAQTGLPQLRDMCKSVNCMDDFKRILDSVN